MLLRELRYGLGWGFEYKTKAIDFPNCKVCILSEVINLRMTQEKSCVIFAERYNYSSDNPNCLALLLTSFIRVMSCEIAIADAYTTTNIRKDPNPKNATLIVPKGG